MMKWTPYLMGIPLTVMLLAGCASTSIPEPNQLSVDDSQIAHYESVIALLDRDTGTITLPLDAYAMSRDEAILIEMANDQLMDDCLQHYGLRNPLLRVDRRQAVRYADRRYGVWTDAEVRYGYELPPNPLGDTISGLLSQQSQQWSDVQAKCYTESDPLPLLTLSAAGALDSVIAVGARGAIEAYVYAAGTPEWKQARKDWWDCMSSNGLTPRTGATQWGPEIPASQEAALRAANIDVACKREVDLVQRLANLEARYQAAFVSENQAALVAQRNKVEEVLNRAREIVGTR